MHGWLFVGGAAAVSVPIIIHLLNRRRFRRRRWAAMQFVLESLRRNRRRLRIEELILLALRCLAVLLIAMLVARLTGCSAADILPGVTRDRAIVYILDDSASMQQALGPVTMFEHARRELAKNVRELSRSEKAAILLACDGPQDSPLFDLDDVPNPESLAVRVEGLVVSGRRARLADALDRARAMLADEPAARQIVLLTDCRTADVSTTDSAAGDPKLPKAFADLKAARIDLTVMDFGRSAEKNLTVEGLQLVDRYAIAGAPCRVRLTVRNNSPQAAQDIEVTPTVQLAGVETAAALPVQRIGEIGAGMTATIDFTATIARKGSAVIAAELPADDLGPDSRAVLALDVRQSLRVLVVDGWADAVDPTARASWHFTHALDPRGDGSYQVTPEVVTPDAMARSPLNEYDVVALLDVADFPAHGEADASATQPVQGVYPAVRALEAYVRGGGGLVIFTGPRVDSEFYNGPLLDRGRGLSPLEIAGRKGNPEDTEQYLRLDPRSIQPHGALRVFSGEGGDLTRLVRFHAITEALEPAGASASGPERTLVLARFSNRAIAVAAKPFGSGSVVAVYTTADKRWNDWPSEVKGTYILFANDLVGSVARRQMPGRTALVPAGIRLVPRDSDGDVTGALLRTPRYPAEDVVSLKVDPSTGRIEHGPTRQAGIYQMNLRGGGHHLRTVLLARNVDPGEGKLDHGGLEALQGALGSDEFTYVRRTAQAQQQSVTRQGKAEYLLWLAIAVIGALAAETYLGLVFGHHTRR